MIDAPSATASLIVAVISIAVPTPYDPLAVVEENNETVGSVLSIVRLNALDAAESMPLVVCFEVTDHTPSASVPKSQLVVPTAAVNEHVTEVEPALVAVTVTVLPSVTPLTERVGVLSEVTLSEFEPEFEPEFKTGVVGVEGVAIYLKPPLSVADCVSVLVTTTSCAPAVPAGVVQVIDVDDTRVTLVHGAPPTVTVAPDKKFVPVMVIDVPPASVPEVPETLDTVGAAASGVTVTADDAGESPAEPVAFRAFK